MADAVGEAFAMSVSLFFEMCDLDNEADMACMAILLLGRSCRWRRQVWPAGVVSAKPKIWELASQVGPGGSLTSHCDR